MIAMTQFAITGEDTRYFLNGALFVLRARRSAWSAPTVIGSRTSRSRATSGEAGKAAGPK